MSCMQLHLTSYWSSYLQRDKWLVLYLCGLHKHPQCDLSWQIILLHNEIGMLHRRSKEVFITGKLI